MRLFLFCVAVVGLCILVLAEFSKTAQGGTDRYIPRYGPDEYGVTCYYYNGGISCVQTHERTAK